jgi:hypothetical protein
MTSSSRTPDEIWKDDLLGRRSEAELLIGYIESILDRPGLGRNQHAYTIAVDGNYGEGKTYFLKRLSEHLQVNHPVAYIDAWTDDLADQPLVALMATLKSAVTPIINTPSVNKGWNSLVKKSGKVAKIAALGAAKRGLGLLISHSAAEALAKILADENEDLKDSLEDALKETSDESIDEALKGLNLSGDMAAQVSDFESAKIAMQDMKQSLTDFVKVLKDTTLRAPIVIVVDELDRCKPSYAVKLLEEIKHLFDVPGVIFILGLHGNQLARSIEGAYGPNFDGKSYLSRFISRRYSLRALNRRNLIDHLVVSSGLSDQYFMFTSYYRIGSSGQFSPTNSSMIIDTYAEAFELTARDLFQLIDILETASSIARPGQLILQYIIPLIVGHMKGLPPGDSPPIPVSISSKIQWSSPRGNEHYTLSSLFDRLHTLSNLSRSDVMRAYNNSESYPETIVAEAWDHSSKNEYAAPTAYPRLISSVGRFSKA